MEHQEEEKKIAQFERLIKEREKEIMREELEKIKIDKHIRDMTLDIADFKRRILDIKRGTW